MLPWALAMKRTRILSIPTASRWRFFYLPALLSASYALLTAFAVFYMPVHFKETLGYSGTQIGLLFGVYGVTALVVMLPSGLSTDAVSPGRVLLVAAILMAVSALGMSQVTSFPAFLAFFMLLGVAGNSVKVASESFLYKTHDPRRTGEVFGLYQVFKMGAYTLMMLSGGYLLITIGFQWTVLLIGTIVLFSGLLALALPNIPVKWSGLSFYVADIRRPSVAVFVAWLFLFTSHWGAETTSYALFLRENLGLTVVQMGWFMAGEFVTFMATAWFVGRACDRGLDLGRVMWVGVVLAGLSHVGMAWPWVASSFTFRMLHGIGDGSVSVVMYMGVSRLFLRERIGGNSGLINFVTMSGVLVGATVYGPMGESMGYQYPLIFSGLTMVALGLFPRLHKGASAIGHI